MLLKIGFYHCVSPSASLGFVLGCVSEFFLAISSTKEFGHLDFALQLHQGVEHGFGAGGASGQIHIHRDDLVNAFYYAVAVLERASAHGASAASNDIFGLCHLFV